MEQCEGVCVLLDIGVCVFRYAAAENDCCTSLALNDKYAKAYLRRGVARKCLGNGEEAGEDFRAVLKLEPANKQAKAELNEIENKKVGTN